MEIKNKIIVAPTELALIKEFSLREIPFSKANLLIGDVHITKNNETLYMFERKSNSDLFSSIKDGRYHDQKKRMLESGISPRNIFYIIEHAKIDGESFKAVWGAICNTIHRDGMSVFMTCSVSQTADFILGMVNSMNKYEPSTRNECPINLNIKKHQIEIDEWFKYSLTLIPGVSEKRAALITEYFPTFMLLSNEIQKKGKSCLSKLKSENGKRLGIKLSEKICCVIANNSGDILRGISPANPLTPEGVTSKGI